MVPPAGTAATIMVAAPPGSFGQAVDGLGFANANPLDLSHSRDRAQSGSGGAPTPKQNKLNQSMMSVENQKLSAPNSAAQ